MVDKKESWSLLVTLLLQTIVPLAIAGGATGILSAFKESLPQSLYVGFLYVIWGVIIAMLIWLVLRLILGDSPKKFIEWIKERKERRERLELVKEWYEKWADLVRLLGDVINNKWQPTDEQERKYRKLRVWFRRNRSQFLPRWQFFERNRWVPAHERNYGSSATLKWEVFVSNHEDPFSYFYGPFSIKQLDEILKYHHQDVGEVVVKLMELTDEFIEWQKLR